VGRVGFEPGVKRQGSGESEEEDKASRGREELRVGETRMRLKE